MRILHVINTLKTGGAEKLLTEIAPRLQTAGHQVDVYVFDGTSTHFKSALEKAGVRVLSYRAGCDVYNPAIILSLCGIIPHYDIIHTHNTSPQLFAAIANIFYNKVLITTEHSTSNRRRGNPLLYVVDKWMYRKYRKIICISDKTADLLATYLPGTNGRIETIYNGIDVQRFSEATPMPRNNNHPGKFIVTMVAGFRYQKDHMTALKAFSYLDMSKYELWLVGDGERKNDIVAEIERLGLQTNVKLLGVRHDVPSILKSSDIILQSSHIEGFGLAAVEGMAAGRPVIATDVPGLSEVVGSAGILVRHENAEELASAIKRLAEDKVLYDAVARNCLERARHFDIAQMVRRYDDLYRSVAG